MPYATRPGTCSLIKKSRDTNIMICVSVPTLYMSVVETFLLKSKIHKVVYFNGVCQYFQAVFWLELLFQASILAWHVITRHASKKLAAVEMLLEGGTFLREFQYWHHWWTIPVLYDVIFKSWFITTLIMINNLNCLDPTIHSHHGISCSQPINGVFQRQSMSPFDVT